MTFVFQVESFILEQEELDCEGESVLDTSQFLLASENLDGSDLRSVDPETQAKLEALLEAAGRYPENHNLLVHGIDRSPSIK